LSFRRKNGERTETKADFLQGDQVQEAHPAQGHAVQDWQSLPLCARQASIRSQAAGLWWTDKTHLPQKGKDNKEDSPEDGVH